MNIHKLSKYLNRFYFVNLPGPLYLDKEDNLHYFDESDHRDHDPKLWVKCFNEHSNIIIPLHDFTGRMGLEPIECIDGVCRPIRCYIDENEWEAIVTFGGDIMAIVIEKILKNYTYRFGILNDCYGRWIDFSENDLHPDIRRMAIETFMIHS